MRTAPLLFAIITAGAGSLAAQADRARACIDRAAQAHDNGKPQLAAALLLRAHHEANALEFSRPRKKVAREIDALARKVDPELSALRDARRDAAKELVGAAAKLARKKWFHAALQLAELARGLDAGVATKVLAGYRRKALKQEPGGRDAGLPPDGRGDTWLFRAISLAEDAIDEDRAAAAADLLVAAQARLHTEARADRQQQLAASLRKQAERLGSPATDALDAMAAAAAPLRQRADAYRQRGWHRIAVAILQDAAHLDAPGTAAALASARNELDTDYVGALDVLHEVFQISDNVTNEGAWKILPDRIESPPLQDSRDIMLAAREQIGPDARITLRAAPVGERAAFGLLFGFRSRDDYLLLDVTEFEGATFLQLLRWDGKTYSKLAYAERDMTGYRGGPVELSLAMSGGALEARLDGSEPIKATVDAEQTIGRIGLFVPEPACKSGGVVFRELTIEKM